MSKELSSDNVVPVICTNTSMSIQYVNVDTGDVVREDHIVSEIHSYGSTVNQALGSTAVILSEILGEDRDGEDTYFEDEDDDTLSLEFDELESEEMLDSDYDFGDTEEIDEDRYMSSAIDRYGETRSGEVLDLVQFMKRAR
jgi:hypothetical protein